MPIPRAVAACSALLAGAVITFALPRACDGERPSDIAPDVTNFELSGPSTGELVVLVHGVSGPMAVFDRTVVALGAAGFQTLRLDLFGRGLSGRPADSRYDLAAYVAQLTALLARINAPEHFDVLGSSMGAMIVSEYTRQNPGRVKKVALVGPAGFPLKASPLASLMTVPFLGEWAMSVFGDRTLAKHNRRYFFAPERFDAAQQTFEAQLAVEGTKRAILATFRDVPLQDYLAGYAELGRLPVPKIVLWGEEDQAFPYANHDKLLPLLPGAKFVPIPHAGHLPQLESPEVTNAALLAFFAT